MVDDEFVYDAVRDMRNIPQGTMYHANRYDTDDEHVLTLYNDGGSWDIRVPIDESATDTRPIIDEATGEKVGEVEIKTGWICPKCGGSVSPWMTYCPLCSVYPPPPPIPYNPWPNTTPWTPYYCAPTNICRSGEHR